MVPLLFIFGEFGMLALRLAVGAILVGNGIPKIRDLHANAADFERMGFRPAALWGTLVALLEFLGGFCIIAGFVVQPIAALVVVQFAVIILKLKFGRKFIGGWELDTLLLAAAVALATVGGGAFSLDRFFGITFF